MCGICGFIARQKTDVLEKMLSALHHRGPDGVSSYETEKHGRFFAIGHCRLAITGGKDAVQPFLGKAALVHNGEIYNHERLKKKFALPCRTDSDSEVVLRLFEHFFRGDALTALKRTFLCLDGSYAIALYIDGSLFLARDVLGLRPLFFSKNPFPAFASERKALWKCGFEDVEAVGAGKIVELGKMEKYRYSFIKRSTLKQDYDKSVFLLEKLLRESVRRRTGNQGETGILFSGGLDSTLLSCLSDSLPLFVCGTRNSSDVLFAEKAAEHLGLQLKKVMVNEDMIENALPDAMHACESKKPMDIGIALPLFFAAKEASRHCRVLLSGSGADELFGGYAKYVDFPQTMFDDIRTIARDNLERDDMVTMAHSVELRHPYLDRNVVRLALSLPRGYLFDGRRKRILADTARRVGVPHFVCERKKTAVQYGSGVLSLLKKIASRSIFKKDAKEKGFVGPLEAYMSHIWEREVFLRFYQK